MSMTAHEFEARIAGIVDTPARAAAQQHFEHEIDAFGAAEGGPFVLPAITGIAMRARLNAVDLDIACERATRLAWRIAVAAGLALATACGGIAWWRLTSMDQAIAWAAGV